MILKTCGAHICINFWNKRNKKVHLDTFLEFTGVVFFHMVVIG